MSPNDPPDISRHTRFADIVRLSPQQPDVIFSQEAKWFNHYGGENRTLWLKSLHLDPWDGCDRLAEVKRIRGIVAVERPPKRASGGVIPLSMWVNTEEIVYSDHRALGGVVAITGG